MFFNNLWQNFIKGDKKALATIFRCFYEDLYNYGFKITRSKDITEDGLQDLFLKLWKSRENLANVENIKAYLFTAIRRVLIDNLRWHNRYIEAEKYTESLEIEFSAEDLIIKNQFDAEIKNNLINALNKLSARQKEAIYLRYFDNLDFDNIASVMEINVQSVRNLIHRGLLTLRDLNIKS